MKNWKQPPPKEIGCRSREVDIVIRCEKLFEFSILAENSASISVKTFFFWRPPVFERKKRLNFRAFREIPSLFSEKPCETDSRTMKIQVKVVCTFLTLSKKPPPPFSKSWLRACPNIMQEIKAFYVSVMKVVVRLFLIRNTHILNFNNTLWNTKEKKETVMSWWEAAKDLMSSPRAELVRSSSLQPLT